MAARRPWAQPAEQGVWVRAHWWCEEGEEWPEAELANAVGLACGRHERGFSLSTRYHPITSILVMIQPGDREP